jgi:hypothetical protein
MPLGTGSITPPGSTLPNDVISPPQATITAIPESTWVVVTVSGQLTFTHNPGCDLIAGDWKCEAKIPTLNFEAAPSTVGPLHLWVQEGVQRSWVGLRGSGGEANSPGSAIGLVREATAGTLQGEMTVFQAWSYNPFSGGSEPTYYISGGYNVTATAVPSPLKLTETDAESDGTRSYTVEPLYGLIFMNPTGDFRPAGEVTWYWIPGDSVSSTPGWSEYNEWIQDCQFQTTCRFKAPGPGKVQAYASVERKGVAIRSGDGAPQCQAPGGPLGARGLRASVAGTNCQEPKVVLTCSGDLGANNVTRGSSIHCEVKKEPESASGSLTVTGWSFEGEPRTDEPVADTKWDGPMVHPGTVSVKARIGTGAEQSASATITVTARDWSGKVPEISTHHDQNGGDYVQPRLPENVMIAHDLGHTRFWPDKAQTEIVESGPNRDYYYFGNEFNFSVGAHYALNDEAFAPGSAFTRAQEDDVPGAAGGSSSGPIHGTNMCHERDVPSQKSRVEAHELQHVRVYREEFGKLVQSEYSHLEGLSSKNESELTDIVDGLADKADRDALAQSQAVVDAKGGPYVTRFIDSNGRECAMVNVRGAILGNN